MRRHRGEDRSRGFNKLLRSEAPDLDPEETEIRDRSSHAELSSDDEEDTAREHYVEVEESKLRRPRAAALGGQYRGSRVSRDDVSEDEGEEDDPFNQESEDEESENEAYDVENGASAGDSEVDGRDSGDELSEPEEAEVSSTRPPIRRVPEGERAMKDRRVVASKLTHSAGADAAKGRAVKKQRTAFDSLLGTRIKLQKALIAVNTTSALSSDESAMQLPEARAAMEKAETAAFNLWSSLDNLREELAAMRAGSKRKGSHFTTSTPIEELWSYMQEQEESSLPHRNVVLQRWSDKTKSDLDRSQDGLLRKSERQTSIVAALQQHLTDRDRLIKRTRVPRSCAPRQLANNVTSDEKIYDDADFYGLLLKELLQQKSQDSITAANIDLDFNLRREAKAKKNVETKASKGRKLRYTVHEKLQNFMAPEDRRRWGERQADELFGSLFGQRLGLDEDRMEEDAPVDREDALLLFRS